MAAQEVVGLKPRTAGERRAKACFLSSMPCLDAEE